MRWFLMASPILRGGNLSVTEQGIREGVRQALLPIWNSYYFFSLYANASNYEASPSTNSKQLLDRYILAKTRQLIESVTADLDIFDSYNASAKVRDFAEVLTNWYIRRSRDRFWEGDKDAFDTLYTVLEAVSRVVAPLLPLISEEIWRGLTNGRSVHLENWPDATEFPKDDALVADMDAIREAASVALSLRKSSGLRVRLPLSELTIAVADPSSLASYSELIADELNVKSVKVVMANDETAKSYGLSKKLTINARELGPRVGSEVQRIIGASKSGNWSESSGVVTVDGTELLPNEYELVLSAAGGNENQKVGITTTGFVLLNTAVSEELELEGMARDAVRHVQQARREAGLDVSDRIKLNLKTNDLGAKALEIHREFISSETLAVELEIINADTASEQTIGEDVSLGIELSKI
jgi:isoleucyl-tRNA synthetase